MKHPQEHKADQIAKAANEYIKWYETKKENVSEYGRSKKAAQIALKHGIRELFFVQLMCSKSNNH